MERKEYKHWQPARRKKKGAMSGRRNPSLKKSRCLIEFHADKESSYFCEVTLFLTHFCFSCSGKTEIGSDDFVLHFGAALKATLLFIRRHVFTSSGLQIVLELLILA